MVEHVLGGDDGDDPGGAQVLHHGVQRQVAVLAQELVGVSCRFGKILYEFEAGEWVLYPLEQESDLFWR